MLLTRPRHKPFALPLKHDTLWPWTGRPEPTTRDFEPRVTVCIAIVSDEFIVGVSDRRLSFDGIIPAADDAEMKQIKISSHWGIMAASDRWHFVRPIFRKCRELTRGKEETLANIEQVVSGAYSDVFQKEVVARVVKKFGYKDYDEFKSALQNAQADNFADIKKQIDNVDLSTSLLVYGFDNGKGCLFEVGNPGAILDRNSLGHWAIGSGWYLAMASLNSHDSDTSELSQIYRGCEAKFWAESSDSGVGNATTAVVLYKDGSFRMLSDDDVAPLKAIWEEQRKEPIPGKAREHLAAWRSSSSAHGLGEQRIDTDIPRLK
jgi:20S proteasome alpha/beta subunit